MIRTKVKQKKCAVCPEMFTPFQPMQKVCSPKCAIVLGRINTEKKEKQDKKEWNVRKKEYKEKSLTHKDYLKLLQIVFNTFIRLRDKNEPCISCRTTKNVEYAAGHYYPTTYSYLRFNEDNVHKQCNKHCNMEKGGNVLEYRPALIKKIGLERVIVLDETRHLELQITIPELKEKILYYKTKINELKKAA